MNLNDLKKALTAEDLIRRYNLENIKITSKNVELIKDQLNKNETILNNFIEATIKNLEDLQNQVDGNITTWFFSGAPTIENEPANEWTTDEEKNNHLGDLYYDSDTGYAYRFTLENNEYQWFKLTDSDIAEALAIANSAKDTADSKRRIFVTQPSPPYDVGDMWLKDNKDIYRCRSQRIEGEYNQVDWIKATDYTNDDYARGVEAILNDFRETVESDYTTNVRFEATKDSIEQSVEGVATKTQTLETEMHNTFQEMNSKFDNVATIENITEVTNRVDNIQTATENTISVVEDIVTNGVSQIHTENNFTFNKDGLNMDATGSPVKSNINKANFKVLDKTGESSDVLNFSGYVTEDDAQEHAELTKYEGQTLNYSKNMVFQQYLSSPDWRIEEVNDPTYGIGLGFFYIGGDD